MDCYCDYEPAIFYSSAIRRAKKQYRCEECNSLIRVGQKYEYVSAKYNDWPEISTFRTCEECHDLRVWTQNNLPCLCWGHGNLIEDCTYAVKEATRHAAEETKGLRFGFLRRLWKIQQKSRISKLYRPIERKEP